MTKASISLLLFVVLYPLAVTSLALPPASSPPGTTTSSTRRTWLVNSLGHAAAFLATIPSPGLAMESLDVDSYLKSGGVSMPMGVSGQGGKMRPTTGVILRDGSQVARDARSGSVLAELVLEGNKDLVPVLATFSSPWPLATGSTYDVECRDGSTGDSAYLAVSSKIKGKSVNELGNQFFQEQLFSNTGRFSFYGAPTNVKVKKSTTTSTKDEKYMTVDIDFSILSQSTGAEVLRKARVIATIPEGASQVVMLVASASALRWKKGTDQTIATTIDSFRAIPAPQTSLRMKSR